MKHLFTEKVVPIESDNPAIKIDYDKCIDCGACNGVCPQKLDVSALISKIKDMVKELEK